ncbi:MAG: cytochrome c biogenesis protein ResB [Bdellovibrionales bacterium]
MVTPICPLMWKLSWSNLKVGRYPGTNRAATYASDVRVKELGDVNISMNEPLKHKEFYFYQASFQSDESGNPTTSILSVNNDPGRFLKYLGSLLITIGSLWLFYLKKFKARKKHVAI